MVYHLVSQERLNFSEGDGRSGESGSADGIWVSYVVGTLRVPFPHTASASSAERSVRATFRRLRVLHALASPAMISLRWIASPMASALYACDALRRHLPFVDTRLAESLREPAGKLVRAVATSELPVERVWANLVACGRDARKRHAATAGGSGGV